jgi:pimeloyl-ACP methyl ester carboxylesterase
MRAALEAAAGLLLLLGAAPGARCQEVPGTLLSAVFTGSFPIPEIQTLQKVLFGTYAAPPVPRFAVDTYRLRYNSIDFDGSDAVITAGLFVPVFGDAAGRPVLVFGSGTTGIADRCAPSLEQWEVRHFGDYRANMLAYAAQGFIVLFPDYLGFNDSSRPQRYFSKPAEAHALLDGLRAVYRYFEDSRHPVRLTKKAFLAGYSQGGHAAFAAADLLRSYAPELSLAGVIGFGATTDVEALLREGPAYAPLVFYSYSAMYGSTEIDPAAYLQERFSLSLARDLSEMCVDQFQAYYGFDGAKLYRPAFQRALYAFRLAASYPSLSRRLAEDRAGLGGHGLPALVLQGGADHVVTCPTQLRFVEALRQAGSAVRYIVYPEVPHKGIRQAGFAASVDWMNRLSRGQPAPAQ